MIKRILFIRTYRFVGMGGPLPPLSLLYLSSAIIRCCVNKYELKILDIGLADMYLEDVKKFLEDFNPYIVCLSSLAWEADLVHKIAFISKNFNSDIIVLAEGQLPTLAKEYLLQDKNIDYGIMGEGENTIIELLRYLEGNGNISDIDGIVYRRDNKTISNKHRLYIENLDDITISSEAWDLIDIREYSKYRSWSGSLREKFYAPILSSRGCPFNCTFCRNREIFGNEFRARSPENVFSEIMFLYNKYKVKEIHFFDAVFNYDVERAKKICLLLINSGINFSLSFPHGLRPDLTNDELLALLRKAGTYKLVYGIETATLRLQCIIKKDLDLEHTREIIKKTAHTGIIVGGYLCWVFLPKLTVRC